MGKTSWKIWLLLGVFLIEGTVSVCYATIDSMNTMKINLADPNEAKSKTIWSEPSHIDVNSAGLGWNGEDNACRDFWLQSKEMSIGLSWRPAQGAQIRVEIVRPLKEIRLPNGQTYTPYAGSVYMRHSPDAKHWSSWEIMESSGEKDGKCIFTAKMGIPQRNRSEYDKYMMQYSKLTDIGWVNDEDAIVRWIVKSDPNFFEKNDPFIGYVQLMYETCLQANQRLKEISITASWAVGGMHQPPKDPNEIKRMNSINPWGYRAIKD